MSTAKSQPLHNFNLPTLLKWGANGVATTSHRLRRPLPPQPPPQPSSVNNDVDESSKPWNLRPRKPASYVHETNGGGEGTVRVLGVPAVQSEGKNGGGGGEERRKEREKDKEKEKRKLCIVLSKEEIEEDVFIMTGSRPARRPKKRAKNVQKQIDNVFPGLWLVGMTADAFRIAEGIPAKK